MKIMQIPTGYIITSDCSRGELETLSIGDYGKSKNIKADFLGYTREINGVASGVTCPLQEKWVITLSTQYGCCQNCKFCDVPKIKFNGNASFDDMKTQLYNAINMFPTVKYTDRLNIHFARMGEPLFNKEVFLFSKWLAEGKREIQEETGVRFEVIHPVLTTSMPLIKQFGERILQWCDIKNNLFRGQAGLQFSINSTNECQRKDMFNGKTHSLEQLSLLSEKMQKPLSRKYCLNFALADGYEVDPIVLNALFDKEKFMIKLTPIHNSLACVDNNIKTSGGYEVFTPYKKIEDDLKKSGWDVIVFIPSIDEENGLVTCGNLLLSGNEIRTEAELKIPNL